MDSVKSKKTSSDKHTMDDIKIFVDKKNEFQKPEHRNFAFLWVLLIFISIIISAFSFYMFYMDAGLYKTKEYALYTKQIDFAQDRMYGVETVYGNIYIGNLREENGYVVLENVIYTNNLIKQAGYFIRINSSFGSNMLYLPITEISRVFVLDEDSLKVLK